MSGLRLRCPEVCSKCSSPKSEVQDTRLTQQGYRYRRRVCLACGHRWNTYETIVNPRRIRFANRIPTPSTPAAPAPLLPHGSPSRPFSFIHFSSPSVSPSPAPLA